MMREILTLANNEENEALATPELKVVSLAASIQLFGRLRQQGMKFSSDEVESIETWFILDARYSFCCVISLSLVFQFSSLISIWRLMFSSLFTSHVPRNHAQKSIHSRETENTTRILFSDSFLIQRWFKVCSGDKERERTIGKIEWINEGKKIT